MQTPSVESALGVAMKRSPLIVVLAFVFGCGTFGPVVQTPASADDEETRFVEIEAVEGRSEALVLEIRTRAPVQSGDRLEIYRSLDGAEYAMLQVVELDTRLAAAIAEGIQYVDERIPHGAHSYVALIVGSDENARESRPIDVHWHKAPAKPLYVDAAALTEHTVELSWNSSASAVAIFRRDVLDPHARPIRLTELLAEPARFVDGNLRSGGVYAYRIAFAHARDGFLHFGAPTEEVYVTLPGKVKP